jgi:GAF domain-containing protein
VPGLNSQTAAALAHLAGRIGRGEIGPDQAFQSILDLAQQITGADHGSIHLLDKSKSEFRIAAVGGVHEQAFYPPAYPIDHGVSASLNFHGPEFT